MDPTLKNRTLTSLKEKMPMLSPRLRIVAKYIVDHPSDFGLDSIRETARKSGVSTYSLVRAANSLGFESYDQLRDPFATRLYHQRGFPMPLSGSRTYGKRVPWAVFRGTPRPIHWPLSNVPYSIKQLIRCSKWLICCWARTVYLTAVRASYALAYYLQYVGRMALPSMQLIPRHQNSAIDDLNDAGAGDVMIAITFTPIPVKPLMPVSLP